MRALAGVVGVVLILFAVAGIAGGGSVAFGLAIGALGVGLALPGDSR